jgi:nicotinate-nucleotide adenylyltransferase
MKVVFGGTFDPVHIGHLRMASALSEILSVEDVSIMPCYDALHKQGVGASSEHRMKMLTLALEYDDLIVLDSRESRRGEASYTIDSLYELRGELGDESLCFVMGADAANGMPSWFRVSEFSKLTHIVVINRSGAQGVVLNQVMIAEKLELLGFTLAVSLNELKDVSAGRFVFIDLPLLDISSSYIRNRIKQGLSIRYLVTDAVRGYICDNALYQN